MGKSVVQQHNEEVIKRAIAARGGACTIKFLPVICSDDQTLCEVIETMAGVEHPFIVQPTSIVRLSDQARFYDDYKKGGNEHAKAII